MHDPDCPFCEVVSRQEDAREVYRDQFVVAFFPTEPAVLGHLMIIPRVHISDIWSLDELTAQHLSTATLRLARVVKDALTPDGLNVIQSNGKVATQSVFHLHVHLVPRWAGDAMGPIWPETTDFSESAKDEVLRRVRRAVSGAR